MTWVRAVMCLRSLEYWRPDATGSKQLVAALASRQKEGPDPPQIELQMQVRPLLAGD